MDTAAAYKTKNVELLYAFTSTVLQEPKAIGAAVHQQKNFGFDMPCGYKPHLTFMFGSHSGQES